MWATGEDSDLNVHVDLFLEKDVDLLDTDEKHCVEINNASGFTKEFCNAENYFICESEVQYDSVPEMELLSRGKFFDLQYWDAFMTVAELEDCLFFLEPPEDPVCPEEVV